MRPLRRRKKEGRLKSHTFKGATNPDPPSLHVSGRLRPSGTSTPGDHRQLAIPVPIPNTVVKQLPPMILHARESRSSPGFPWPLSRSRAAGAFSCLWFASRTPLSRLLVPAELILRVTSRRPGRAYGFAAGTIGSRHRQRADVGSRQVCGLPGVRRPRCQASAGVLVPPLPVPQPDCASPGLERLASHPGGWPRARRQHALRRRRVRHACKDAYGCALQMDDRPV
jgi:hypothetical protein